MCLDSDETDSISLKKDACNSILYNINSTNIIQTCNIKFSTGFSWPWIRTMFAKVGWLSVSRITSASSSRHVLDLNGQKICSYQASKTSSIYEHNTYYLWFNMLIHPEFRFLFLFIKKKRQTMSHQSWTKLTAKNNKIHCLAWCKTLLMEQPMNAAELSPMSSNEIPVITEASNKFRGCLMTSNLENSNISGPWP